MQDELEGVGDRLENKLTENLNQEEKKQLLGLLQKMLKLN